MTRTAVLFGMITLQRPAGASVLEGRWRRLTLRIMAAVARRCPMAIEAGLVVLIEGADALRMLLALFVTARAVVFMVAVGATQVVGVYVRLVPKLDAARRVSLPLRLVDLDFRFRDRRVHAPHQVVLCRRGHGATLLRRSGLGLMAYAAGRFTAPFPMAAHALSVVGAF